MKIELVSSLSLHTNVRLLWILRSAKSVSECICILGSRFCIWFRWTWTLLVNDWSLSVKHVQRVLDGSLWALNSYHFRWLSIWQCDHLVRHQVPFEWVSICVARTSIAIIVLVSFRIENLPDPGTRVVCCLAYRHLINSTECFTMTLLSVRDSLAIGNFSWLNWR